MRHKHRQIESSENVSGTKVSENELHGSVFASEIGEVIVKFIYRIGIISFFVLAEILVLLEPISTTSGDLWYNNEESDSIRKPLYTSGIAWLCAMASYQNNG